MALVWVLLAIVVLGGVAVVAAGRGQGLTPPEPDRPDLSLPSGRPLARTDVDQVRFSVGLRGYRMDEVDDVLDRLAYDLEARDARIAVLEQEVATRWAAGPPAAGSAPAPTQDSEQPEAADEPPTVGPGGEPEAEREADSEPDSESESPAEEVAAASPVAERPTEPSDAAPDGDDDDGEVLVGRTMIVPFQQTDSRFGTAPGADAADAAGDDGPERGA